MSTGSLLDAMRGALALVENASTVGLTSASDADLRAVVAVGAALRQAVERHTALVAGEVARRSRPELGSSGFVQRAGHRTVEEFLKVETGITGRDAATAVRVGVIATSEGALGDALREGRVSVPAADAIRSGLGDPIDAVPPEVVEQATRRLCEEAELLDPDRLQRRAREVRDEVDEAGIPDRERTRHAARSLRLVRQADGMTRIVWLLDPESATIITTVYDRATSPRRGGPRFIEPTSRARAQRLVDDDRTTEQLASDAFTELLRQSATLDTEILLGGDIPGVQVLIAQGRDYGVLPGGDTVGASTVQRIACASGILPVVIDRTGQVLDLGRRQRLFTRSQRRALAVRDGGCRWPGCDRPPSWTEAHHIIPWTDGGRTDLADGILLCRHHHLRLHNERWTITRRASGEYRLHPPPRTGTSSTRLETKSRAVRELLTQRGEEPARVAVRPRTSTAAPQHTRLSACASPARAC